MNRCGFFEHCEISIPQADFEFDFAVFFGSFLARFKPARTAVSPKGCGETKASPSGTASGDLSSAVASEPLLAFNESVVGGSEGRSSSSGDWDPDSLIGPKGSADGPLLTPLFDDEASDAFERLGLGGGEADKARLEEELRLVSTMVKLALLVRAAAGSSPLIQTR